MLVDQTSAPPPTVSLSLRLVGCTMSVGASLPEVSHGIRTNLVANPIVSVAVDGLTLDGLANTSPTAPQGISEGILFATDNTNASLTVRTSSISRCGTYGLVVRPFLGFASLSVSIEQNTFHQNGRRATGLGTCDGVNGCFDGAGAAIELTAPSQAVSASIAGNIFTENKVGLLLHARNGASIGAGRSSVFKNQFFDQMFDAALASFPAAGDNYSGTGALLSADNGGTITTFLVLDSNEIHDNDGRGVLVVSAFNSLGGSSVVPVLRNDRIYLNGSGFPAVPGPQEGVEVYRQVSALAFTVSPFFVHETVWNNASFGINNVNPSASSRPEVWNSIVWENNGTVPNSVDLQGFNFNLANQGNVFNSDFCAPFFPGICGQVLNPIPANNFCISSDPLFVTPPGPPATFEIACVSSGGPPCPSCASLCADGGSLMAPSLPRFDALGNDRTVNIVGTGDEPDMGAIEKQTCSP